jgi:hypothetical protein
MRSASKSVYSYLKTNKKSILISIITYSIIFASGMVITYHIAFEKGVVVGVQIGKRMVPNRLDYVIEWGFYCLL